MTISRGSDKVAVQRYIGMTQEEAIAAMAVQGFVAGDVVKAPSGAAR